MRANAFGSGACDRFQRLSMSIPWRAVLGFWEGRRSMLGPCATTQEALQAGKEHRLQREPCKSTYGSHPPALQTVALLLSCELVTPLQTVEGKGRAGPGPGKARGVQQCYIH